MLSSIGISPEAEDSAIRDLNDGRVLITNIDIVTPIHDDPYTMGKIAACNVTNDLFALNAVEISNYSAFLGIPFDMPDKVITQMMLGSRDFLSELGSDIHGGHTIMSPWAMLGGTASAIVEKKHLIPKQGVQKGDRLILTKPIGLQAIMASYRVMQDNPDLLADFDFNELQKSVSLAEKSMMLSNQQITKIIHSYNYFGAIHAMTDVTGFGFSSHLGEMLVNSDLGAKINHMPVFPKAPALDEDFGYGILEGCGAEIAGPMLLSVDRNNFDDFTRTLSDEKVWWFEVGEISPQVNKVKFEESFQYIETDTF